MRSLEPFLPYMKLLLSALYQLPLTHVPTYRGVKLDLAEVGHPVACYCGKHAAYACLGCDCKHTTCMHHVQMYNQLVGEVWSWWSFSSTSKDKNFLLSVSESVTAFSIL